MMNDDDILETDDTMEDEEDFDGETEGDDLEEDGMAENISENETEDM